ncbi:hypothetical protein BKA70DRAFT_729427 [Coprinopsis sp. MPI-PUGE-AT-0042]|nr:hypothetical protein BKA70DRAFT_729427 [Coprinopsis sp. MPI-PUGE-AT-0042]
MSIFKANPRLLQYPRLLAITTEKRSRATTIELESHFLSIVFPFFANSLRRLEHVYLLLKRGRLWAGLTNEFQDAIINCLRGNDLKSFKMRHLSLPGDFVHVLPSTLNACFIGGAAEDDPTFTCKYVGPRNQGRRGNSVSPTTLGIKLRRTNPSWAQSQEDAFFRQVSSLKLEIGNMKAFQSIMDRVPSTLTHLSLQHQYDGYLLRGFRLALEKMSLRLYAPS